MYISTIFYTVYRLFETVILKTFSQFSTHIILFLFVIGAVKFVIRSHALTKINSKINTFIGNELL